MDRLIPRSRRENTTTHTHTYTKELNSRRLCTSERRREGGGKEGRDMNRDLEGKRDREKMADESKSKGEEGTNKKKARKQEREVCVCYELREEKEKKV